VLTSLTSRLSLSPSLSSSTERPFLAAALGVMHGLKVYSSGMPPPLPALLRLACPPCACDSCCRRPRKSWLWRCCGDLGLQLLRPSLVAVLLVGLPLPTDADSDCLLARMRLVPGDSCTDACKTSRCTHVTQQTLTWCFVKPAAVDLYAS
jgi:hypothetical protein